MSENLTPQEQFLETWAELSERFAAVTERVKSGEAPQTEGEPTPNADEAWLAANDAGQKALDLVEDILQRLGRVGRGRRRSFHVFGHAGRR